MLAWTKIFSHQYIIQQFFSPIGTFLYWVSLMLVAVTVNARYKNIDTLVDIHQAYKYMAYLHHWKKLRCVFITCIELFHLAVYIWRFHYMLLSPRLILCVIPLPWGPKIKLIAPSAAADNVLSLVFVFLTAFCGCAERMLGNGHHCTGGKAEAIKRLSDQCGKAQPTDVHFHAYFTFCPTSVV